MKSLPTGLGAAATGLDLSHRDGWMVWRGIYDNLQQYWNIFISISEDIYISFIEILCCWILGLVLVRGGWIPIYCFLLILHSLHILRTPVSTLFTIWSVLSSLHSLSYWGERRAVSSRALQGGIREKLLDMRLFSPGAGVRPVTGSNIFLKIHP